MDDGNKSSALSVFGLGTEFNLSEESLQALSNLSTGEIPQDAVREHPGKGGRVFKYVKHTWLSNQLRAGFGMMWSFDTIDCRILPDGSAYAIVKLTLHIPMKDGTIFHNTITEVGIWEDLTGKQPDAAKIASAVSRGLARCCMRRFGLGEDFYDTEEYKMTAKETFDRLLRTASEQGMSSEGLRAVIKGLGISTETLPDNYMRVWRELMSMRKDTSSVDL